MVAADAVEAIAVEAFRQCEWRRKVDVMAAQAYLRSVEGAQTGRVYRVGY